MDTNVGSEMAITSQPGADPEGCADLSPSESGGAGSCKAGRSLHVPEQRQLMA